MSQFKITPIKNNKFVVFEYSFPFWNLWKTGTPECISAPSNEKAVKFNSIEEAKTAIANRAI